MTVTLGEDAILSNLRGVGYDVGSLTELRHSGLRYSNAIPVLVDALSAADDRKILMEVVRALSVPWAGPMATRPLMKLFRQVEDASGLGVRWAVGNALEVIWNDEYFEELVDLALDRSYGRSREMIVLGMAKSERPEAGEILVRLLGDSDVDGHAVKALRKVKVKAARPALERMIDDPRAWVRREAQHALSSLD